MARVVKKPEERKEELLDIAIKLFMEKGYINTSVKDIYTQANGSFGMFYHHFASKEEIFEAAMVKYTDLFVSGISEILQDKRIPYPERYKRVLIHWMGLMNGRDKVRGTWHDVEVFRVLSGKMLSGAIDPVRRYLDEGIEQRLIKTDDSHSSAIFIVYGTFGLLNEERSRIGSNDNALHIFAEVSQRIAAMLDADEGMFNFAEEE
ncbi:MULTISPECIES: TetR/AcrR family transcriptional regulator [unclassified Paenibacillus]|uniref:TetR/AcrR family transcriptional regulator n=1 Tax=unclassified Paenibacillus TaxID=185978 RepID=UPI000839C14F|nr:MULTISPECIES: TetR/AcrR family transcriptional regulator [unclassified Paenibacillus]NWL88691.1 TetR/AcrR family transcriptional regulator [Paenibacillus sp. 79R4]